MVALVVTANLLQVRFKFDVSNFAMTREYQVKIKLAANLRAIWVGDWKRVAWSDESLLQLLHANGRLGIWCQAHEAMDPACQNGTVQGHGGSIMV
ncbi:hypothetical protein AVEN_22564-1 [Araneus ventricosus]|uniref:Uncharacterized protein n=1 Tax=Araneus ventricosus TaxID=182803 RepID=A0A4Y2E7B6_ARAVE|nr:hypothetical protein AVEN_22564-1 [Araneus ventricosus]